jgi:outer membrane lipoprotein carrier protein
MKKILIIICSFIFSSVSAQVDQKARQILEQASKKMQSFQTISIAFTFTMENAKMNIHEKNSGSLLMKGEKYQVKLPDMGMQVFSDGKTVWTYMKEANQVTISNAGDEGQGVIDPTTIFNVYQEGFIYKFMEDKSMNGKVISYVELMPLDKTKEYSKMVVGIEKDKQLIFSLVTYGKDENLYGIYVNDFKSNQPVADSDFVFDKAKFKDVEVVDFR